MSLVQLSPFFWRRRFPIWDDADAGAEQWYKTIAKLMQGRNFKLHTHNANLVLVRSGLGAQATATTSSYLVDPASSHMLVLKIKPCMSKYKHLYLSLIHI